MRDLKSSHRLAAIATSPGGTLAVCFSKGMQEHEQPLGAAVQNPEESTSVMAAQLTELSLDLGAMRKGKRWIILVGRIQEPDVPVQRVLSFRVESADEFVDRLPPGRIAVVDGLHPGHRRRRCQMGSSRRRPATGFTNSGCCCSTASKRLRCRRTTGTVSN